MKAVEEAHLLAHLPDLDAGERIDPIVTARLVESVAKAASVDLYDDDEDAVELPDYPDGAGLDEVDWTAGHFLKTVDAIAKHSEDAAEESAALLAAVSRVTAERHAEARAERDRLAQDLSRFRRKLLLPDEVTMQKVNRYETALERSLYKALHELQRLQAARQGCVVPPPAVVDVDVSGDVAAGDG